MKKILTAAILCSWFGVAHAASFPDTFVSEAEGEGGLPSGVILSVETDAEGNEIALNTEARSIDVSDLASQRAGTVDPAALFASGRELNLAADDLSSEILAVPVPTLVLPSIISVVTVAATSRGRYARYGRHSAWHSPRGNYYYYHRCGPYYRCR